MHTMDYGKAFGFVTEDPDWVKKFIIAGLVTFVPFVGGFLLAGYALEVTRRVIQHQSPVLPEWADLGGLIKNGIVSTLVTLAYVLPLAIIVTCMILPIALTGTAEEEAVQIAGPVLASCFGCLAALYGLLIGMVLPAAYGKLAATGEIGAAFRVVEVFQLLRGKPAVYLLVWAISGFVTSLLVLVGSALCGIGSTFGAAFGVLASAHLHGQAYLVASQEGGAPPAADSMMAA